MTRDVMKAALLALDTSLCMVLWKVAQCPLSVKIVVQGYLT